VYVDSSAAPEAAAGKTLATALDWLKANGDSDKNYTLLLGADETLASWTLGGSSSGTSVALNGKTNVTLTLKGKSAERIIQPSGPGSLFTLAAGVTLVLDENITLKGIPNNTASLIQVNATSAKLEMKNGSRITDNTFSTTTTSSSYGGGVSVSAGIFTMSGGTISGNPTSASSSYGGGVSVSGGTFIMNSGTISGNIASFFSSYLSYGNGVYVGTGWQVTTSGTFAMSGTARVALNNPVYFASGRVLTLDGALTGSDPAAALELDIGWIGKTLIQWETGLGGALPVNRFIYPSGYTVNGMGVVSASNAAPLPQGTPSTAWLAKGDAHLYRIAATLNRTYSLTRSAGSGCSLSAAYPDGTVIFSVNATNGPPAVIADRTGDIIVSVSNPSESGAYTLSYTEQ
jgi:hypothetical protein